jgi:hypothetical protein
MEFSDIYIEYSYFLCQSMSEISLGEARLYLKVTDFGNFFNLLINIISKEKLDIKDLAILKKCNMHSLAVFGILSIKNK